jgi:lipoate-protein ligase A
MKWRLLLDGAASGAWNMAVDEALLLCAPETSAPVLRFYSWNPLCLSLGRFQKWQFEDAEPLPFDVVRRPTGGRAVWHQYEVTYSIVLHEGLLPCEASSVVGSYRWLSEGFLRGLQALGVRAEIASGAERTGVKPIAKEPSTRLAAETNCFDAATRADFVVDGRKLLGAAQCRHGGALLQHGSLLLDIDEAAWKRSAGGTLRDVVTLAKLGVNISRDVVIAALLGGMEEHLDTKLQSLNSRIVRKKWRVLC